MVSSTHAELILATCILGIAIVTQRRNLACPLDMDFFDIALAATGVFFGLGAWAAFFYGDWSFVEDAWVSREPVDRLVSAYWIIGSFMGTLWLCNWLLMSLDRNDLEGIPKCRRYSMAEYFHQCHRVDWGCILAIYLMVYAVRLIIVLKYGILFSGTSTPERVSSLPYSIVILSQVGEILSVGCLVWASVWSARQRWERWFSLGVLLLEAVWAFAHGRRWFLAWLLIALLGSLASGWRVRLRQLVVMGLVIFVVAAAVFPFFTSIRHAYYFRQPSKDIGAVQNFAGAAASAAKGNPTILYKIYKRNMATRPLFLRAFVCDICRGLDRREPMMGTALVSTFRSAIPSAVLPEKNSALEGEQLIQAHFCLPIQDSASTWPAFGCADFGRTIGGICVGIVLSFWILLMACWCDVLKACHPFVMLCLAGATITCLLQVEEGPSACWIMARNLFILVVGAVVLFLVQYFAVPARSHVCAGCNE